MQSILEDINRVGAVSSVRDNNTEVSGQMVDWFGIIETLYAILLFLLPVFFLPFTADPLSVNKAYLTIIIAVLALTLFFASGIQKRKLSILGIDNYIGLMILPVAAILSAIFSVNSNNSLFGHFGNYTDSVLFVLSLSIIGFVAANIRLNLKRLAMYFFAGVSLSTLASLYVLYGFSIPTLSLEARVVAFAGTIYNLLGLQIVAVIASIYYLLSSRSLKHKVIYIFTIFINASYLAVLANLESLAVLLIGVIVLFLFIKKEVNSTNKKILIGVVLALSLIGFVSHYPMTREVLGLSDLSAPERLPLKESWIVTADTIKNYPLQGIGIGTFVNAYSLFRPDTMNSSANWNARFETPYSDLFLWMVAAGLVGLAGYISFVVFSFYLAKGLRKGEEQSGFLRLVIFSIFLALLILGNNPILYVLLFLLLGIAIQRSDRKPLTTNTVSIIGVFAVIAASALIYVSFSAYRVYAGQYFFKESLTRDNLLERYSLQSKAIMSDSTESVYQRSYISTAIAIASAVSAQENITEEQKQQITAILREAFNNILYITNNAEPVNVLNWSLRGDLYASIMDLDQAAYQEALIAYNNATRLEPTNPDRWINLGSVFYRQKVYSEAINAYARAATLKTDYANARYNLAYALKDAGYLTDAVTQMEVVTRLVPAGTPDHEKALKELADFKKLADEAATNAQRATPEPVEQVDNNVKGEDSSETPLTPPEDQPASQLESNPQIEGEVQNITQGEEEEGQFEIPNADGSEVPEGGEEAPIAN